MRFSPNPPVSPQVDEMIHLYVKIAKAPRLPRVNPDLLSQSDSRARVAPVMGSSCPRLMEADSEPPQFINVAPRQTGKMETRRNTREMAGKAMSSNSSPGSVQPSAIRTQRLRKQLGHETTAAAI